MEPAVPELCVAVNALVPARRALASLALVAAAAGCSSAGRAAGAATSATATAVATTGAATTDFLVWIWPFSSESGPDAQRERMREQAGTERFRNAPLVDGREAMRLHHTDFAAQRENFVSPAFTESKARFRSGGARPRSGLVLGRGASDPATARALLLAASRTGIPVIGSNPVLAGLLPAFGN